MKRLLAIGLIALAALCALPGCEYERMKHTDSVRPYERAMPEVPAGAIPATPPTLKDAEYSDAGGEAAYRLAPIGEIVNPTRPAEMAASVKRGERVYTYFCIQCHGHRYNGDGTVGQSFYPLPTDLRSELVQAEMDDDALFRSISYGAGLDKETGNLRNPPLFATVSVADRWHVINFIRSLGVRDPGEKNESGSFNDVDWVKNKQ